MTSVRPRCACVVRRYGQGGACETLCDRLVQGLVAGWSIRILSVDPESRGNAFCGGTPVRSFREHRCENPLCGRRGPWSPELETHLAQEPPPYERVLFLGVPLSLAWEVLRKDPTRCRWVPLEEDLASLPPFLRESPCLAYARSGSMDDAADILLRRLHREAPALFAVDVPPQLREAPGTVQRTFFDLRRACRRHVEAQGEPPCA